MSSRELLQLYSLLSSFFTQMIRKSVETRDWLNTIEPRNVRAVMKRIVEDVTAIDTQVGQLYEEGVRKAHSSGLSAVFTREMYSVNVTSVGFWQIFAATLEEFPIVFSQSKNRANTREHNENCHVIMAQKRFVTQHLYFIWSCS